MLMKSLFTIGFVGLIALYILALAICISFILWMLIDAGKHDRFWWIFLMVFFPGLGAATYYYKYKYVRKVKSDAIEIIVKK